jgi:hypothetical protein
MLKGVMLKSDLAAVLADYAKDVGAVYIGSSFTLCCPLSASVLPLSS